MRLNADGEYTVLDTDDDGKKFVWRIPPGATMEDHEAAEDPWYDSGTAHQAFLDARN